MKTLRIGVVGLGHRGRNLLKLAHDGFNFVEIAAACDIREDNFYKTQWLMDKPISEICPGAVFYDDYDTMLDKAALDAVIVETGADIHAEFCCKALKKNINVLSDIPNVANLVEAEHLWKAASESTATISTGANPNEAKFAKVLLDLYKRGFLGKPYCMEVEYIHWSMPGSDANVHLNENGDWRKLLSPIRYCTHSLGPLLAVMEELLTSVSCFGTGEHAPDDSPGHIRKDDMQCAQFRSDSDVVVRIMRNGCCRAQGSDITHTAFSAQRAISSVTTSAEAFRRRYATIPQNSIRRPN